MYDLIHDVACFGSLIDLCIWRMEIDWSVQAVEVWEQPQQFSGDNVLAGFTLSLRGIL